MTQPPDIADEWRGILAQGERILWQGGPSTDVPSVKFNAVSFLFGVAAVVFIPFLVSRELANTSFDSQALLLILIGLAATGLAAYQAFGKYLFDAYKLRHSFYTLSSRRAYTGWLLLGRRRLDTWTINRHTKIELDPGHLGSVYFAEKIHHTKHSTWIEKIGFLNIPDASAVYDLMLKVQRNEA